MFAFTFVNLNTLTPSIYRGFLAEAALKTLDKFKEKTVIQRRCSAVVEAVDLSFTPISSLIISNSSSEQHFTIQEVAFRAYYEV